MRKTKEIVALLLALVMILISVPSDVFAAKGGNKKDSAPMILSAQVEVRDLMCQDKESMTINCYEYNNGCPTWSESATTTWSSVAGSCRGTLLDSRVVSYGKGNAEKQKQL